MFYNEYIKINQEWESLFLALRLQSVWEIRDFVRQFFGHRRILPSVLDVTKDKTEAFMT